VNAVNAVFCKPFKFIHHHSKDKPRIDHGYIVPDNSNRLEEITGRSYLENRLIYFQDVLDNRILGGKDANLDQIEQLRVEIDKIKWVI
jgi:hypothetical protein